MFPPRYQTWSRKLRSALVPMVLSLVWIADVPAEQLFVSCRYSWRDTGRGIEITREQDAAQGGGTGSLVGQGLGFPTVYCPWMRPTFREWARLMHRRSGHHHRGTP